MEPTLAGLDWTGHCPCDTHLPAVGISGLVCAGSYAHSCTQTLVTVLFHNIEQKDQWWGRKSSSQNVTKCVGFPCYLLGGGWGRWQTGSRAWTLSYISLKRTFNLALDNLSVQWMTAAIVINDYGHYQRRHCIADSCNTLDMWHASLKTQTILASIIYAV